MNTSQHGFLAIAYIFTRADGDLKVPTAIKDVVSIPTNLTAAKCCGTVSIMSTTIMLGMQGDCLSSYIHIHQHLDLKPCHHISRYRALLVFIVVSIVFFVVSACISLVGSMRIINVYTAYIVLMTSILVKVGADINNDEKNAVKLANPSAIAHASASVHDLFVIFDGTTYQNVRQMVDAIKQMNGHVWVSCCMLAARIHEMSTNEAAAMYV